MKLFILAAQCAGKTTLARYFRAYTDLQIVEIEDRIIASNGGTWPKDSQYKETVLIPKILTEFCAMDDLLFCENHMSAERTSMLKRAGFKVLVITVSREELLRRNQIRIQTEGYKDASMWIDSELENLQELGRLGLVDFTVDGEQSPEAIAQDVRLIIAQNT